MHRTTLLAAPLAALVAARLAFAQTTTSAPAGGGLPALDVKVDLESATLDFNGAKVPIALPRMMLPGEADVMAQTVAIGLGRHVVHVRVPAKDEPGGIAWEAIVAGGHTTPLFSGLTGLTEGDPGERTGKIVQVVTEGASGFVLVGDVREDLNLCGQRMTLLEPRAIYPASLQLRPATVQRLTAEQRATAQTLQAVEVGGNERAPSARPLAGLLVARGSSVAGSTGAELTDDDVRTSWIERRPGAGQGEFVVLAAPKELRITRLRVVLAPPNATRSANGAAPKSFYLVTSTQTFHVVLPAEGPPKSSEGYEVAFPQPLETSCVALVLDGTSARRGEGDIEHPDVGLAEIRAYSELDSPGATLDDVAKKLSSDRGVAAAELLERAGGGALLAVEKAYDGLDVRGRSLAVDVAASRDHCEDAASLLVRALCGLEGDASRKAREKLARCKEAVPLLTMRLRDDASTRACIAPLLSSLAPERALDPLADALADAGEAAHDERAALRLALGEALRAASPARLIALLGDRRRSAATRLEIMRASRERVREAMAEADAAVAELLSGAPPMRTRYLVIGPLGDLARAGDRPALARLVDAMTHDPEWPVRAHAAETAGGIDQAQDALLTASGDPEPRVREAALQSLAGRASPGAVEAAARVLSGSGRAVHWTFVVIPAIAVLAAAPPSTRFDETLAAALRDRSTHVRVAVLGALAARHAASSHDVIRERVDDKGEDPEVRAAAARALGALCDAGSADRLTALARALGAPGDGDDDQQVAFGALSGLAALKPRDMRERVAPLLAATVPPYVRAAAQQAVSAPGVCR